MSTCQISSSPLRPLTATETVDLFANLRELPASFHVLDRALAELDQPECTNESLQDILLADPASAADVTRLANSAYFGVSSRIKTTATAIRVVGHRRLKGLFRHLMVGKLYELLAAERPEANLIRDTALETAVIGCELSEDRPTEDADEIRLLGLVHNLAESALLVCAPEPYLHVLTSERARQEDAAFEQFSFTFAEMSAKLLEFWKFPAEHVAAVHDWRDPWRRMESSDWRTLRLHVAARLARGLTDEELMSEHRVTEPLGLDEVRLQQIREKAPAEIEALRSWLF